MFPAFSDNYADVNKVVYYTSKANLRNEALLSDVLCCGFEPTAKEEQEKFEEIIREVNGEKIKPQIIRDIYSVINERLEAQEETGSPVRLGVHELGTFFPNAASKTLINWRRLLTARRKKASSSGLPALFPPAPNPLK